jgi:tRNA (cytidine32/uridine32-2'-O)-methyltransferase
VARSAQGPVALLVSDERSGLTNAEVEPCHDLSAVPTAPEQPSINLAQDMLLYAYEVRVALLKASAPPVGPLPIVATDAERLENSGRSHPSRLPLLGHMCPQCDPPAGN